ncbi:MAG: TetR/AcrR family transcriptional regulator [Pseudomonadales bacterium]|nr:TetR/AcrR family transcriptional regulator [Pseudomonadales bacterium]
MSPASIDQTHKREGIILAVAGHLVREGFANSGIRALADSAGISDRMLMYYFESKDALIASALMVLARNMSAGLDLVLPRRVFPAARIVEALVQAAEHEDQKAVLRLWFEIVGLAIRGQEPYRSTVSEILAEWESWIADRLRPGQKQQAGALLAQIEGQLMLTLLKD